jgi:hypothetical protein
MLDYLMFHQNSIMFSLAVASIIVVAIILLALIFNKFSKKEEVKTPSGGLTSFFWNDLAKVGSVYTGLCPECEGLGKERQSCPNCKDENDGEMITPLKVLLEKYPDFLLSHITRIEIRGGKVTL